MIGLRRKSRVERWADGAREVPILVVLGSGVALGGLAAGVYAARRRLWQGVAVVADAVEEVADTVEDAAEDLADAARERASAGSEAEKSS